jgi:hypothetical protein
VIYDVYPLMNSQGRDDPVDALRDGPRRGLLVISKRYYNSATASLKAELFALDGSGKELLPAMDNVRLVAENEKGKVIEGRVTHYGRSHKSRQEHSTQRWLCKIPGLPAVLNTEKLLKRSAERLSKAAASGFDPADDDRID